MRIYHETVMAMSIMKQEETESLDNYKNRFNQAMLTLEIGGGDLLFLPF